MVLSSAIVCDNDRRIAEVIAICGLRSAIIWKPALILLTFVFCAYMTVRVESINLKKMSKIVKCQILHEHKTTVKKV